MSPGSQGVPPIPAFNFALKERAKPSPLDCSRHPKVLELLATDRRGGRGAKMVRRKRAITVSFGRELSSFQEPERK